MIFAVKLFSGFLSQFFLYLISIFSFFWFGKWIAKTIFQKLDLPVNVQFMLLRHRTPSPIDPSVRTDSRWGEGGTLKLEDGTPSMFLALVWVKGKPVEEKPLELLWKVNCCFVFLNNEKIWKQIFWSRLRLVDLQQLWHCYDSILSSISGHTHEMKLFNHWTISSNYTAFKLNEILPI